MEKKRDTYFDVFKGVMILSVINIHTVYWSLKQHTPDIVRELAYFVDIPIFFFISGYFARHSAFFSTASQAMRQLIRLYGRYLVISALVAAAVIVWAWLVHNRIIEGLVPSLLSIFTLQLEGELWGYFKGYYGNLWYLHTYFPLLLLVPLLIGFPCFARLRYGVLLVLLLLYAVMRYWYPGHVFLLREWGDILFYSVFFVLGTTYRIDERSITPRRALFSFLLNCSIVWLIVYLDGNQLRLSAYKFPPSWQWLFYSLLLVHVFALIRPYWSGALRPLLGRTAPMLEWIGRNSFTVYLIQGLVCSIPFLFADELATRLSSVAILYGVVFAFNVTLSVLLSWIYCRSADYSRSVLKRELIGPVAG